MIKNRYFLSLIGEMLNCLNNAIKYIKLNLRNAYYRFRIKKDYRRKISFRILNEYLKYIIISFNLINIFVIFQGYTNKSLTKLINIFYIIYLNNILIFFVSENKYLNFVN